MDCREFRRNHVAFVDDLLPGIDIVRMQRHLLECEGCAHHDTLVRRALLVVRNIPSIQPSPEFSARLEARLRTVRAEGRTYELRGAPGRGTLGTFAALASGVAAAGLLGFAVLTADRTQDDMRLPPVVASIPADRDLEALPIPASAIVASASTGMSVWSTVFAADQAPLHLASAQFRLASYNGP
jgi:hypothetical protein